MVCSHRAEIGVLLSEWRIEQYEGGREGVRSYWL